MQVLELAAALAILLGLKQQLAESRAICGSRCSLQITEVNLANMLQQGQAKSCKTLQDRIESAKRHDSGKELAAGVSYNCGLKGCLTLVVNAQLAEVLPDQLLPDQSLPNDVSLLLQIKHFTVAFHFCTDDGA